MADELSDDFLDAFRISVKKANPEAIIIGEVWENAADKIAYGKRRRYLRGAQLDCVMNYPLRQGILSFILEGNGAALARVLTEIYSSYPKCVCDCLMNVLGTHDTERILSVLGDSAGLSLDNALLATRKMDAAARRRGTRLLRLASMIQFTVYGVPSIFYGDEAGMEGGHDPFCRRPFPWGREDKGLEAHYRLLGKIRKLPVFASGDFQVLEGCQDYIYYISLFGGYAGARGRQFVGCAPAAALAGKRAAHWERFCGSCAFYRRDYTFGRGRFPIDNPSTATSCGTTPGVAMQLPHRGG